MVICTTTDMSFPRHCSLFNNKIFIDPQYVRCFLQNHEMGDPLYISSVVKGVMLSSRIYPLIYDTDDRTDANWPRSINYLSQLKSDDFSLISIDSKVSIRDLFLASWLKLTTKEEDAFIATIINKVPTEESDSIIVDNLRCSFYPTSTQKQIRFIGNDYFKSLVDVDSWFAISTVDDICFRIVFIDPTWLSYHNFENILHLDSYFEQLGKNAKSRFIGSWDDNNIIRFEIKDKKSHQLLLKLNDFNLNLAPFNKSQRGGERFIFKSSKLARYFESVIINMFQNSPLAFCMLDGFVFVNHVFRYNRFRPSDNQFTTHLDTPYYDPHNKHYSKYTLLVYLTDGKPAKGEKSLIFNSIDKSFDQIHPFDCFIFDQKLEHTGNAFANSDKIFLRSELIFRATSKVIPNTTSGVMFNQAVYLSRQSIFYPELEKYANEAFNHVNRSHYKMLDQQVNVTWTVKMTAYDNMIYATDGVNYLFPNDADLRLCSVISLLDCYGAVNGLVSFEKSCRVLHRFNSSRDIKTTLFSLLNFTYQPNKDENNSKFNDQSQPGGKYEPIDSERAISFCSECTPEGILPEELSKRDNPRHSLGIVEHYRMAHTDMLDKMSKYQFTIFGTEIFITNQNITITDSHIIFENPDNIKFVGVNFASCYCDRVSDRNWVETKHSASAVNTLVPPIPYFIYPNEGSHIIVEIFNGGWSENEAFPEVDKINIPYIPKKTGEGKSYETYFPFDDSYW